MLMTNNVMLRCVTNVFIVNTKNMYSGGSATRYYKMMMQEKFSTKGTKKAGTKQEHTYNE